MGECSTDFYRFTAPGAARSRLLHPYAGPRRFNLEDLPQLDVEFTEQWQGQSLLRTEDRAFAAPGVRLVVTSKINFIEVEATMKAKYSEAFIEQALVKIYSRGGKARRWARASS